MNAKKPWSHKESMKLKRRKGGRETDVRIMEWRTKGECEDGDGDGKGREGEGEEEGNDWRKVCCVYNEPKQIWWHLCIETKWNAQCNMLGCWNVECKHKQGRQALMEDRQQQAAMLHSLFTRSHAATLLHLIRFGRSQAYKTSIIKMIVASIPFQTKCVVLKNLGSNELWANW